MDMDEKPGGRMTLRFFLGWSSAYRSFADVHNDYFYTYRQPLVVVRRNTPAIVLDRKRLEEPGMAQPVIYAARDVVDLRVKPSGGKSASVIAKGDLCVTSSETFLDYVVLYRTLSDAKGDFRVLARPGPGDLVLVSEVVEPEDLSGYAQVLHPSFGVVWMWGTDLFTIQEAR